MNKIAKSRKKKIKKKRERDEVSLKERKSRNTQRKNLANRFKRCFPFATSIG